MSGKKKRGWIQAREIRCFLRSLIRKVSEDTFFHIHSQTLTIAIGSMNLTIVPIKRHN